MDRESADLLLMGVPSEKPPLRLHPIERELHALVSMAGRMANSQERIAAKLEGIGKDIAVLRSLIEREAATDHANTGRGLPTTELQRS